MGKRGAALGLISWIAVISPANAPAPAHAATPTCFGAPATIVGTPRDDRLRGTSGRDVIVAMGGEDRITGRGGRDLVCGGPGADEIYANLSGDRIGGGGGGDLVDYAQWLLEPVHVDLRRGIAVGGSGRDELRDLEHITGTVYEDILVGSHERNFIDGGWDDDIISGLGGNDNISGGETDDGVRTMETLTGGKGSDSIVIEPGARGTVRGGAGDDTIVGEGTLQGGAGADRMDGVSDDDELFGGPGDDSLSVHFFAQEQRTAIENGGRGLDYCDTTSGSRVTSCERDLDVHGCFRERPTIFASGTRTVGTNGDDVIKGNDGADVIEARGGADLICSGDGADRVDAGDGADRVALGDGNDVGSLWDGHDYVVGGPASDRLIGGNGDDLLEGGSGVDSLSGGEGKDSLAGHSMRTCVFIETDCTREVPIFYARDAGNDLRGGPGSDEIFGGRGDDRILGGMGRDLLDLTASSEDVHVDLQEGVATGGIGTDSLGSVESVLGPLTATATLIGNDVANFLRGGPGVDSIIGGGGDDDILTTTSGSWNDAIEIARGGDGNDRLSGSAGSEELYGEAGDDELRGEGGADRLYGGIGFDLCILLSREGETVDCERKQ